MLRLLKKWRSFKSCRPDQFPSHFEVAVGYRLMWDIEVDGDQITIAATSQFFDTNGNTLTVTCASATGTRFEDAQDDD